MEADCKKLNALEEKEKVVEQLSFEAWRNIPQDRK